MGRTPPALLALALALACGSGGGPARPAPDVLLVIVDTLRADRLGVYGYPQPSSPRIDAFAAEAVVFERGISGSSSTGPSHASIFSSRFTRGHSVGMANGSTRLEGLPTLAEAFRNAGYATAAFVGNAMLHRRLGFDRGFSVYDDEFTSREAVRGTFERTADDTTARALAWLEAQTQQPFFLWVHYQDPHGPYTPPQGFEGRLPIAPRPGEQPLRTRPGGARSRRVPAYQVLPGLELPSAYESRYAEEVLYADHYVGELLDALDARTSRETVVLLTADHGEAMGEGQHFFEHGVATTPDQAHVPFLLRAPGLAPGRRGGGVHHVDVAPTLLELAGVPVPAGMRGVALGPFLRSGEPLPERLLFCDDGGELSAYRGTGFVRVSANGGRRAFERYVWSPGGAWSRQGRADASFTEPIQAYLAQETPTSQAESPSPELAEQLRALGYVVEE